MMGGWSRTQGKHMVGSTTEGVHEGDHENRPLEIRTNENLKI